MATAQQRARQKQALGRWGEKVAERYLSERGFTVLGRNWRCGLGEIDLVLREDDTLVVCEVKTRRNLDFGHPLAAVNAAKAERLSTLAMLWVEEHGLTRVPVRVDMVGVLLPVVGKMQVEHVRGIH
ncbi:MAG: YraN family protein [Marmoricola sp.]